MMESFVLGAMVWIAAHSSLDVRPDTMVVEFATKMEIACVLEGIDPCVESTSGKEWLGYYLDGDKTVSGKPTAFIASDMPDDPLATYSIVLHETVHHLQSTYIPNGGAAHRECQAYLLENEWLEDMGASMIDVFSVQPFYHQMRMYCVFRP